MAYALGLSIAAFVICVFALVGSKSNYARMWTRLNGQVDRLMTRNGELLKENTELESRNVDLQDEIRELEEGYKKEPIAWDATKGYPYGPKHVLTNWHNNCNFETLRKYIGWDCVMNDDTIKSIVGINKEGILVGQSHYFHFSELADNVKDIRS